MFEQVDLVRLGTKMKIIFVRHGEPDYRELEECSYTGFGLDLAPLREECSYTGFGLDLAPLRVEPLLHEWQVYETGIENFEKARTLFLENKGELLPNSPIQYETAEEMKERFLETMIKYRDYQTVLVVAHRMLMRQFVPDEKIDFCQVIECEVEI